MLGAKSPIRLAQLAIAASFGPVIYYLADEIPPIHRFFASTLSSTAIVLSAIFLCLGGIGFDLLAEYKLKNAIAADRWSEDEMAAAHAWIRQPVFTHGQGVFLLLYIGTLVYHSFTHAHLGALGITIWPSLTVSRIMIALKPTPPTILRGPQTPAAPVYSSNWGQSA